MSSVIALVVQVLHLALMLATAPLALGVAHSVAARLAGRTGPPALLPWRDLLRLSRKQAVFAEAASGLFEAAPALAFAASLLAAALVPSFALGMAAAPAADLIVIAGLLLLARAVLALAAMESGTALGGVDASRAMARAACTEPALLLAILPLALLAGSTNLDAMAGVLRDGTAGLRLPLVLAILAVAAVAVARLAGSTGEAGLAAEYSGRHLALLVWGGALRRLVWLSLLADLAMPFGLADAAGSPFWWLVGVALWAAKLFVLTVALAVWQSARADRPERLAAALGVALLLALLAAALVFAGQGLA